MKEKLKLEDLEVASFVTKDKIKAGADSGNPSCDDTNGDLCTIDPDISVGVC